MAKVTLFRTTDGQLHETEAAHDAHQRRLRAKPALEALVENTLWSFNAIEANGGKDKDIIFRDQLANFINDHADNIRKILTDSLTAKRAPRKLKSVKPATTVATQSAAFVAASSDVAGSVDAAKAHPFPGEQYFLNAGNKAAA